jgi:hypothetical protein
MSATSFVTLAFVDKRWFLTVTQLVLPLHECPAEPLQDTAEVAADLAATESAVEPLHAIADSAAALTETSCI